MKNNMISQSIKKEINAIKNKELEDKFEVIIRLNSIKRKKRKRFWNLCNLFFS